MDPRPVTILMTATVSPHANMPGTMRADPDLRMSEYIAALEFYHSLPTSLVSRIAICENSTAPLDRMVEAITRLGAADRSVIIRCPSDYPAEKGKGFGEFLMLDFAVQNLIDHHSLTDADKIWKVTGRLRVKNLESMIKRAPDDYGLYCDLRHVPFIGERLGGNRWMELRIVSFSVRFYKEFFHGMYGAGFVLEKEFFEAAVVRLSERGDIVPRFRVQPRIEGFSGYSNASYSSGLYKAKSSFRAAARHLMPGVWF